VVTFSRNHAIVRRRAAKSNAGGRYRRMKPLGRGRVALCGGLRGGPIPLYRPRPCCATQAS
ncbi:unnamed protein product, partial [Acidocella sp. C78]